MRFVLINLVLALVAALLGLWFKRAKPRWVKGIAGLFFVWFLAGLVSLWAALVYERVKYGPDADPAHLDPSFFGVSVGFYLGLAGSIAVLVWVFVLKPIWDRRLN
jgi:hypothetical protein